jgi:hypothetical protein
MLSADSRTLDADLTSLPTLDLEDLWDWSYCPMRVWWRKAGDPSHRAGAGERLGQALVRRSVQGTIEAFYHAAKDRSGGVTLLQAFGQVWRSWLRDRGMGGGMANDLLSYHAERKALLHRFGPEGDLRRPDGTLYQRPTWTRAWKELAQAAGLSELEQKIDLAAEEGGIPRPHVQQGSGLAPTMGLGEAFSDALGIVEGLKNLPGPDEVLAVAAPAVVDLLSTRLTCRADLVVDLGEKPVRGRPPKGSDGPRMGRRLAYEFHLFDEEVPSLGSLQRDLRVLALSQALPSELDLSADELKVERLVVRHMRSGAAELIRPLAGTAGEILDALARAVLAGIRSGAYIPRMVCGWPACGDCECRPLCFAGEGILGSLNPALQSQIQSSQRLHQELCDLVEAHGGGELLMAGFRAFAGWMASAPGLNAEGAQWLLDAVDSQAS